jgi:hypothetical protein
MRIAIVSAILGIGWNVLAFLLTYGQGYRRFSLFFRPEWLAAGLVAGLAAGAFTVWTGDRKTKSHWRELLATVSTYYLAVGVWWATLGIGYWLEIGSAAGDNSYYDLSKHLEYGLQVMVMATIYGPVLIPLCWLSRGLVRRQLKSSTKYLAT